MGSGLFKRRNSKSREEAAAPQTSQLPFNEPAVDQSTRPRPYPPPAPMPSFPRPPVHLRLEPVSHPGCAWLLKTCPDFSETMASHHDTLFALLYGHNGSAPPPAVAWVIINIKSMPGVAHTHGSEGHPDGKEIHVSAEYVDGKSAAEIYGVLLHELVHCWQYNGLGSAPGGFIEGLADFVRLRGGLGAAHWQRSRPGKDDKWDAGYERTAFFLDWLESRYPQSLAHINSRLKDTKWGDWPWQDIGAHSIDRLWADYKASFGGNEGVAPVPPARPTH